VSRGLTDLAIFEMGSVFHGEVAHEAPLRPPVHRRPSEVEWADLNSLLPRQPTELAAVFTGQVEGAGWWGDGREAAWADAVETARVVADACGVSLDVATGDDPAFHPGRVAALLVDGAVVGAAGELHPRVTEVTGLPARAAAMWLDLDAVIAASPDVREAPVVGSQPIAKEDVAVVVDREVPAAAVQAALADGAGELLESVRLFDVYEGPQVPEGKKSLAFALRFRAPDRTLDAAETAAAREAAVAHAGALLGATLRA
jgi:phenylalanyl-tRNA synthetase beta chain